MPLPRTKCSFVNGLPMVRVTTGIRILCAPSETTIRVAGRTKRHRGAMRELFESRRQFLRSACLTTGAVFLTSGGVVAEAGAFPQTKESPAGAESGPTDYTLHIKTSPIEIAPNRISRRQHTTGQFPGPLLRFKEGQQVTVDVFNDTDAPEQVHWHGQMRAKACPA